MRRLGPGRRPIPEELRAGSIRGPEAGTRRPGDPPARLERVVEDTVDRSPDAIAVEAGADTLTYAELDARANRLAHPVRVTHPPSGARQVTSTAFARSLGIDAGR